METRSRQSPDLRELIADKENQERQADSCLLWLQGRNCSNPGLEKGKGEELEELLETGKGKRQGHSP